MGPVLKVPFIVCCLRWVTFDAVITMSRAAGILDLHLINNT